MNFKQFASILAFSILSLASVQAATIKKLAGSWKGTITEISDGEKFTVKVTETNKVFQKTGIKSTGKVSADGQSASFTTTYFPNGDLLSVLKFQGRVVSTVRGNWSFSGNTLTVSAEDDQGSTITGTLNFIGKNTYMIKQSEEGSKSKGTFKRN